MAKVYEIIDFQRRETGSKELITKFGGQPDWVAIEDWPVSAGWENRKMTFIGQIFLKKNMLGNQQDLMVYLFMTQPECFEDSFYDPDIAAWEGGETAVRIQRLDGVQTPISGASGPTVFDENDAQYEYLPVLKEIQEADEISQGAYAQLDSEQFDCIDIDKIGGTPAFFQGDDTPQEGCWKLLLQLHCNFLPFVLRAGGSPTMFVYVSKDFEKGGILIQDS